MHEDQTPGEALSVRNETELLRAHSAALRARRLAVLSATSEQRAIWEEWRWRRERRGSVAGGRSEPA